MKNLLLVLCASGLAVACGGRSNNQDTTAASSNNGVQQQQQTAGGQLIIGRGQSNFGTIQLNGGFMPDPNTVDIVSGGNLHVTDVGVSPMNSGTCAGWVTAQPDIILNYSNPAGFLRIFAQGNGQDTTLVINDGNGNWWCSDDDGGNLNPMIDLQNPPAGQYDIWLGSYQAGTNARATIGITELPSVAP